MRTHYTPAQHEAAALLDLVRAGVPVPQCAITHALQVLGDLAGARV